VREFVDQDGTVWVVSAERRPGPDFKGRFVFVARPEQGDSDPVVLDDVRWNSERTALRTLQTASPVELRRRLRWAIGRS
jgi:hypothetical protein